MFVVIATGRLICTHKGLDFHLQGVPVFRIFSLLVGGGVCTSKDFPVLVIVARSTELSMKVKTVI